MCNCYIIQDKAIIKKPTKTKSNLTEFKNSAHFSVGSQRYLVCKERHSESKKENIQISE
jgi:hypothetical protein